MATMSFPQIIFDGLERMRELTVLYGDAQQWNGARMLETVEQYRAALSWRGLGIGDSLIWDGEEDGQVLALRLAAMARGCTFVSAPGGAGDAVPVSSSILQDCVDGRGVDAQRDEPWCYQVRKGAFAWSEDTFSAALSELRVTLEEVPRRIAVLAPLSGFGGELCLAAWSLSAPVHYSGAKQPAGVFAFLERVAADRLIVSEHRLRQLLAHPASVLARCAPLQTLLIESSPGAEENDLESLVASGPLHCEKTVVVVPTDQGFLPTKEAFLRLQQGARRVEEAAAAHPLVGEVRVLPDGVGKWALLAVPAEQCPMIEEEGEEDCWNDHVQTRLAAHFTDFDWHVGVAATQRLARIALLSMVNALSRRGVFTERETGYSQQQILACAAERHRPLVSRWLAVLEQQGLLRRHGDGLRVSDWLGDYDDSALEQAWDDMESVWREVAGSAGTIEYARENSACLAELLSGQRNAVEVLFPAGRMDLAEALYRESPAARYQHQAVAVLLTEIVAAHEQADPMRILEVGAGTGATSEVVLPALAGEPVSYLYTDFSRFFLDQAVRRLENDPRVTFAIYDIDSSPEAQGFSPNDFDVVIGGGVLNAARDTDASVRWLQQLLRPGGWLVITEPTMEEFWVMASQAFMLADASDERAQSGRTFLSLEQWHRVMAQAGLRRVLDLPPSGHPLWALGHRVFAARAKTDRAPLRRTDLERYCRQRLGDVISRVEILDRLPELRTGEPAAAESGHCI